MDADVVCVAPENCPVSISWTLGVLSVRAPACGGAVASLQRCNSRKIGHCQRRVRVEVVRLYEALEEIPTHLGRLIGAQDW